jgi:hypothetical protein
MNWGLKAREGRKGSFEYPQEREVTFEDPFLYGVSL